MGTAANAGRSRRGHGLSAPASLWSAAHPAHHPDLFLAFDSRAIARRFRVWWPGIGRNTLRGLYRLPGPQFAQFGGSHALGRPFLDRLWILHAERYIFSLAPHPAFRQLCLRRWLRALRYPARDRTWISDPLPSYPSGYG